MGGFGSGRNYYAATPDVEECRSIDSDQLSDTIDAPDGAYAEISWGDDTTIRAVVVNAEESEYADALRFKYTARPGTDDAEQYEYKVNLDYTEPHFGGVRVWFLCPWCRTRRGKLYLPPGEERFACRECHDLQYRSSRDSGNELKRAEQRFRKAFSKADKDGRKRHPEGTTPPLPEKPKGMHQETFDDLMDDVWAANEEWYEEFDRQVSKCENILKSNPQ